MLYPEEYPVIDAPPADKKRRSILPFCLGTVAAVALVMIIAWVWTPLRVRYSAWRIERGLPHGRTKGIPPAAERRDEIEAEAVKLTANPAAYLRGCPELAQAVRLADLGPPALPAFRRLLRSRNEAARCVAALALRSKNATWALPLLVELAQDNDPAVAWQAFVAADLLTEEPLIAKSTGMPPPKLELVEARRRLLDWWERAGRARYGSGAE